jgi:hypothetical protein
MHTVEGLQSLVEDYKSTTESIMAANPAIRAVEWEVRDIPYAVFEAYRKFRNEGVDDNHYIEAMASGNKFFYYSVNSYGHGCQVVFWSTPVKFKHIYEVIEGD